MYVAENKREIISRSGTRFKYARESKIEIYKDRGIGLVQVEAWYVSYDP